MYSLYFSLEIQSTDQRKFREEPAIESVVSSVMERIVSTVEMSENRNIANVENSVKIVKKATNRRGQEKGRQYTVSFKAEVIGEHEFRMKDDNTEACNFTKINTPPWVFLTFLNCTNAINRATHHIYLPKLKKFTGLHRYYFC